MPLGSQVQTDAVGPPLTVETLATLVSPHAIYSGTTLSSPLLL